MFAMVALSCAVNHFAPSPKYSTIFPTTFAFLSISVSVKTKSVAENNVFGFSQGTYPYEFAPPIDYDVQFTKTILDPINRFIEVMGYNNISPNLFMINSLF